MYPWLWFWPSQLRFPWSGNAAQDMGPNANWFFDAIPATAGVGRIERRAFEVASYGRQLGLITDVLLDLAAKSPALAADAAAAVERLKSIRADIEKIKAEDAQATNDELEKQLKALMKRDPVAFTGIIDRLVAQARG